MSIIVVLKEKNTLILSTDSRMMTHNFSGVASDAEQKIQEIAPGTFIATSGRKMASEFQVDRARELAIELGTTDIQVIGAALERESLPCLTTLVERLRLESDEITRQAVSGKSLLHGCMLVGRTAGGQLGYVFHSYRVKGGVVKCETEAYFGDRRKIAATAGGSARQLTEIASQFTQNPATWIDPPEQVSMRFLETVRRSNPMVGGPYQVVRLDAGRARWISKPPAAVVPVGNLTAATITAAISITAPTILGGHIAGAEILSTLNGVTVEANGSYDSTIGGNTGLRVRSAAAPDYRVVVVPGGVWMMDPSNVCRVQILGDGTVSLYDASGVIRAVLDATNGQLLINDDLGTTRAQVETFSRAGHISVNGTGASITINGRSL